MTLMPASVLNVELKSARGPLFRLSDYSGKVLVINLWATWAGPCRLEVPALIKLQSHFWSLGVRIVGLSTEDPKDSVDTVREFVRNYRTQYKIGWATTDVTKTLMQGRDAIPQTFVISPSGRIVKRFIGFNPVNTPQQFEDAIEDALKEEAELRRKANGGH
ncbi:MAG: TlpA disulfide reductase family protein [Acidobacteriota bacterium]